MDKKTTQELTGQEKVEHYLNIWGSDKRSLVSILRQLIFIIGLITTIIVAIWVVVHAISFYFTEFSDFRIITDRLAKVSIVFIVFVIVLDSIYLFAEIFSYSRKRKNRVPSMLVAGGMIPLLITFTVLTCVELFGYHQAERSYIYCIYLVVCFACCLFSTIYCFDAKQRLNKWNPNNKLLKSLSYTIGFLGIFAVLSFILWIMWYGNGNDKLQWTCFIFARTIITLIGSIIVKLIIQIILIGVMRHHARHKKSRIIYLSILFAVMLGLELGLGYCFLLYGPWRDNLSLTKALMSITIVFVIAISALDIAIASKYAQSLEKEENNV